MEELKIIIGMLSNLPNAALWVLTGFLVYKLAVVGSVYGLIRFAIDKLHDWLVTRKAREVEYKEIRPMLDGMCVRAETDRLIAQLHRIRGKGVSIESSYIHAQSVEWLREAIDAKVEAEMQPAVRRVA